MQSVKIVFHGTPRLCRQIIGVLSFYSVYLTRFELSNQKNLDPLINFFYNKKECCKSILPAAFSVPFFGSFRIHIFLSGF